MENINATESSRVLLVRSIGQITTEEKYINISVDPIANLDTPLDFELTRGRCCESSMDNITLVDVLQLNETNPVQSDAERFVYSQCPSTGSLGWLIMTRVAM